MAGMFISMERWAPADDASRAFQSHCNIERNCDLLSWFPHAIPRLLTFCSLCSYCSS